MRAVLRRAPDPGAPAPTDDVLEIGDVRLDLGRHELTVRGDLIALPRKEFDLLELLMHNAGRVLTRETLLDQVWGLDYVGDTKTLDVHVKRIRSKIEADPAQPARLTTIRGVGYRFEATA
jgi:two-component system response regulator RegX3